MCMELYVYIYMYSVVIVAVKCTNRTLMVLLTFLSKSFKRITSLVGTLFIPTAVLGYLQRPLLGRILLT